MALIQEGMDTGVGHDNEILIGNSHDRRKSGEVGAENRHSFILIDKTQGVVLCLSRVHAVIKFFKFKGIFLTFNRYAARRVEFFNGHIDAVHTILTILCGRPTQRSGKADDNFFRRRKCDPCNK